MDGDSSHFTKILANLTAGTSKDDALKAMGASAKQEGDQIRLYCPKNTHYVYATISNDKVTAIMRLQSTWSLLLVKLLALAGESHADASGVFNPVDIMEDMHETPRFQIQMLDELVPDSKLSNVLSELRSAAHAAERRQTTQSEASDTPAAVNSADVIYDPIVARAGRKWKFLCQIPRVSRNATAVKPVAAESDHEAEQKNEETITRGLELLQPLRANCITHTTGWWTFEYCHDRMVRQYHRMAPDSHGHVAEIEYRLGEYSHRKQQIQTARAPVERSTQIRRIGRKQFLTQVWAGGTLCDITRQPREVEVQFHCDANSPERIAHVEEVAVCQYVVVINTPRLCVDPGFYDTVASTVYDIKCQRVVPDAEVEEREQMLRLEAEDDNDDTVPLDMLGKPEVEPPAGAEQAPQIVVSLNDPRLAKVSHQNKDMVRRMLALAYGDMHLNVEFSEPSDAANDVEAAKEAAKNSGNTPATETSVKDQLQSTR
ncbi:Protein OS-9 [Coemansia sp. RSA 720]|nr:Protein OS-9 [Coemansia sp. RSA 720]